MLAKSLLAVTLLALTQSAMASPPGCMLGVVNTYSNSADIKSVCQDQQLPSKVASACGNDAQTALSALSDICNGQSVKIATNIPTSSSGTSKPSGTASASSGAQTSANATVVAKPSGSTATTGAPAKNTNAAGRVEIGVVAVVAGLAMAL